MELKCSKDQQIGDWNFAVNGGAIGTYGTGIFIDEFSVITDLWLDQNVALASGGLATVSIGYAIAGVPVAPTAFMPAVAFGGPYTPFRTTNPTGVLISAAIEITFSIAVANLTAGRMLFMIEYFNKDI